MTTTPQSTGAPEPAKKRNFLQRLGDALKAVWESEPARIIALAVAGIVAGASALHIVLSASDVAGVVEYALPVLIGGELIRTQVSPA